MIVRNWLRRLVADDGDAARRFGLFIQTLVVVSVAAFAIATVPGLSPAVRNGLHALQAAVLGVFAIEYVMRLVAAPVKRDYVFSLYGLADLLVIAPILLAGIADLSSLKVFRAIRLFRLFKLTRYVRAADRLGRALRSIREELALVFVIALILLYLSAVGIYVFEHEAQPDRFGSVPACFWWSIVSLTTVGYGDMVPITSAGRSFASVILLAGVMLVTAPTGLFASALMVTRPGRAEPEAGD